MDYKLATILASLMLISLRLCNADEDCPTRQSLVLGTTGILQCSFQEGFYRALWYNSTNVLQEDAIIIIRESVKSGNGYLEGRYDAHPNGSLVVFNVSREHERNFTLILLKTDRDTPARFLIHVLVDAKTFTNFPVINNCSNMNEVCLQSWDQFSEISCFVQDARLVIPLAWMVRTVAGDKNTSSHFIVTNTTTFYTSSVTTTNPFIYSSFLTLFVCKADNSSGLLEQNESLAIIRNKNINLKSEKPEIKYLKHGSNLVLKCSSNQFLFLVWQVKTALKDEFEPVIYASFTKEMFSHTYNEDYKLESNGALIVDEIKTNHEGVYSCISGDGLTDHIIMYKTTVFIVPVPAYPTLEGCNHQQYCTLEVQEKGSLTCSVRGIRPSVELTFKTVFSHLSHVIDFYDKELTINGKEDYFDISLTSKYRIKDTTSRVSIKCEVAGVQIKDLHLTTTFDILIMNVSSTKNTASAEQREKYHWIILSIAFTVVICGIIFLVLCKRQRQRVHGEEGMTMLPTPKDVLIQELKSKYEDLYESVQPIPYIKDRLYCVNKVFVEGGIEYLESINKIGDSGSWKTLETYQKIMSDSKVTSQRCILEGEPGYGKSTLTLQLTYDWCNKIDSSPLRNVDILILLRLRQLGNVPSIYRAIKQFLLPKDSTLSEEDIKSILQNKNLIVTIVLDGFDEYPDQDSGKKSDIISIITKKMFQKFEVVLTTRSSCLPKNYSPTTRRFRLTGFDDNARAQYILRAVVGANVLDADRIKKRLQDNPVLAALCQVPLFFVMFAHMTHENEHLQQFNSVTSFFRYAITCFHTHMKNKMKDENVKKHDLFETDHRELDKIAFKGLSGKEQKIVWRKEDLCTQLGQDFYNQYVKIGILVEEDVLCINDQPSIPLTEHVQYTTEVRFYHKLFCEWYAAHYLVEHESEINDLPEDGSTPNNRENAGQDESLLQYLDPLDTQYLFRFACGLNPVAGERIIQYVKGRHGGERFAALCILEQEDKVENLLLTIKQLCTRRVEIKSDDNLLLQRSTMQLLEIASSNEIQISSIRLCNCLQAVALNKEYLCLSSDLNLPTLDTLNELVIYFDNDTDLRDMAMDILDYSARCNVLKTVRFMSSPWRVILLPQFYNDKDVLNKLLEKSCQVQWVYETSAYEKCTWQLKLYTGKWKREGGDEMTVKDYEDVVNWFEKHKLK